MSRHRYVRLSLNVTARFAQSSRGEPGAEEKVEEGSGLRGEPWSVYPETLYSGSAEANPSGGGQVECESRRLPKSFLHRRAWIAHHARRWVEEVEVVDQEVMIEEERCSSLTRSLGKAGSLAGICLTRACVMMAHGSRMSFAKENTPEPCAHSCMSWRSSLISCVRGAGAARADIRSEWRYICRMV